jgi:CDP-diacylglycerol---glycerol-3-phosphate 3-phosphatidyltransferase
MLTDYARRWSRGFLNAIARFLGSLGISPNAMTIAGFLLTAGVAVVLGLGHLRLAGVLLIVTAGLDAVDGAMARLLNRGTVFGAFLDSTLDRYAEIAVYLALVIYFHRMGSTTELVLAVVTICGSLMVSYTKARAEGVGIPLKGGLLGRFERLVILIAALILNQITYGLWIIAIFANITALQRIWLVWQALNQRETT